MRLIDADKLATRIEEMPCYYDECIDTIEAIVEMIKYDTPPVKAITIEWLKRYELAKGQEVRLQDAINAWEKENEVG